MSDTSHLASVGFRHVIEDGLCVLTEKHLPEDRKKFVLDDLAKLFREAKKGSELVQNKALFIRSDQQSAYERFSLLERYWNTSEKDEWIKMLEASENAFQNLKANDPVPNEVRRITKQFLSELLASLNRESNTGIPYVPEDVEFTR